MSHVHWFIIKVGDLLRNPGHIDMIDLAYDQLDDVPELVGTWLVGTLRIQWVSDGSVKATLDAQVQIEYICDLSNEPYETSIQIDDFYARFVADQDDDDKYYDDVFVLDSAGEFIDIYDFLVQAIKLQEPIRHIKPGKEYLLDEFAAEEDEDEIEDGFAIGGGVYFH